MSQREMVKVPDWIKVTDANVPAGTRYWRLSKVEYWDDQRSGGTHHIYTMSPYDSSKRIAVSNGQQTWEVPLDKPNNEPSSNFAMWGGNYYKAWMTGMPSDTVEGMHMPAKHHVSYLLWWEEATKVGGSSSSVSTQPAPVTAPPVTAPAPSSTPSATKRRLTDVPDWVRITDADVPPGTEYWQLARVDYWDDQRSGGTHHIYTMSPHDANQRIVVSNGQQSWEVPLDKPNNEPSSNFAMWGGNYYKAYMKGLPSDSIEGLHMPAKHHVSYLLWWKRAIKEGSSGGSSQSPAPVVSPPPVTPTPAPQPPSQESSAEFSGNIVQTFTNGRLTQLFGVVHDRNGQPVPGTRLRITWQDSNAANFFTTAGQYVRAETDASGWEFNLNTHPIANTWLVAVVDQNGNPLSENVTVRTDGHGNYGAVNVAKIRFVTNRAVQSQSGAYTPPPTPAPTQSAPTATQSGSSSYQSTPTPAAKPFQGEIMQTFQNRGLTQLFGVIHDRNGRPMKGLKVRLTWPNGQTHHATAGNYVRNETDSSGWDFFLNSKPIGNTWYVAIVDEDGTLLSNDVAVKTDNHANRGAVNVAKIRFVATE